MLNSTPQAKTASGIHSGWSRAFSAIRFQSRSRRPPCDTLPLARSSPSSYPLSHSPVARRKKSRRHNTGSSRATSSNLVTSSNPAISSSLNLLQRLHPRPPLLQRLHPHPPQAPQVPSPRLWPSRASKTHSVSRTSATRRSASASGPAKPMPIACPATSAWPRSVYLRRSRFT